MTPEIEPEETRATELPSKPVSATSTPARFVRIFVPFGGILFLLQSTQLFVPTPAVHGLALWVIAGGAVLSITGAVKPEQLEKRETSFLAKILNAEVARVSPFVAVSVFMITGFAILQSLLLLNMWLVIHLDSTLFATLDHIAWIGVLMVIAGIAAIMSNRGRAVHATGWAALVGGALAGTLFTIAVAIILLAASFVILPAMRKIGEWIHETWIKERSSELISPSLYYGLSAVAAGSVWIAASDAMPTWPWYPH